MNGAHEHAAVEVRLAADRLRSAPIYWTGIVSIVIVLVAIGVVVWMMRVAAPGRLSVRETVAPPQPPPEIGIVETRAFGQPMRSEVLGAAKRQRLRSFGWVDEDAGVLHIPIESAMQWLIQSDAESTP